MLYNLHYMEYNGKRTTKLEDQGMMLLTAKYSLCSRPALTEDGTVCTTYGIFGQEGTTRKKVHDLSTQKERVEELVAMCNRNGVPLYCLDDVIEDFLVE